jgi:tripartite-type tricarboxylate transporter receptor subunit TctC
MRYLLIAICLVLGFGQPLAADFPSRPVRLVVPLPAGTSTDVIGRILAEKVSARLGQQVVVDNKPGADGAVAATELKRASADGYTIMLASNSAMSGVPATRTSPPYDVSADFTPITDVGRYSFFFFVTKDIPANTLSEFIEYAKSNPGKLNYGAGNITGRLSVASVAVARGLNMTHVPYRGEPPAMTDLITGRIQAMVATPGTGAPHVRDGKIRALATVLQRRSPLLPDVPTISEAGFPDFVIEPWAGLFGPPKMPRELVEVLNKAFADAMADPAVGQRMAELDFVLTPSSPEELEALVKRQLEAHRKIVAAAGIEMQ